MFFAVVVVVVVVVVLDVVVVVVSPIKNQGIPSVQKRVTLNVALACLFGLRR